uniref:Glycosyltransferase n=1 Tax=viral metagenome TaxID=1070528 RepID=A0A6C0KQ16_9ZZZZ
MKLLLFLGNGLPHPKNHQAIRRMCRVSSIDYEETLDIQRLTQPDYNILISCYALINPDSIPSHVKIIFGPQFFVFPDDRLSQDKYPVDPSRCVYNCLSDWVKRVNEEFVSTLNMPLVTFPFGVDTNAFCPYTHPNYNRTFDCAVYIKRRSTKLIDHAIEVLKSKNLTYHIFKYGSYQEEDYKHGVRMSTFMLVLDAHESQGFALEEAMSCNTPLLVVDATTMYDETNDGVHATYEEHRPKRLLATSVPYWSDECGIKITDPTQLSSAIDQMMSSHSNFTPREYVLRTLSDEVCMKRILDYFQFVSP